MSEVSTRFAHGTPSWVDLMTTEGATAFYGALFGWDMEVGPAGNGFYTMAHLRGLPVAGIGEQQPGEGGPVAWTVYFAVDDLDETLDKIKNAGGAVFLGPLDVMDQGRMAVAADPTGAVFGMWQAGQHAGARVIEEPGAMCWREVNTRDTAAARSFYRAVFGHDPKPLPGDLDYTTLHLGDDKAIAGIMGMGAEFPPDVPPHWLTYFAVADADAAADTIRANGGQVLHGPFDSDFGRIAVVQDPQGGVFSIIAMTEQQ
jgi:uncharacterized protein